MKNIIARTVFAACIAIVPILGCSVGNDSDSAGSETKTVGYSLVGFDSFGAHEMGSVDLVRHELAIFASPEAPADAFADVLLEGKVLGRVSRQAPKLALPVDVGDGAKLELRDAEGKHYPATVAPQGVAERDLSTTRACAPGDRLNGCRTACTAGINFIFYFYCTEYSCLCRGILPQ
jgi:hypothetical protein